MLHGGRGGGLRGGGRSAVAVALPAALEGVQGEPDADHRQQAEAEQGDREPEPEAQDSHEDIAGAAAGRCQANVVGGDAEDAVEVLVRPPERDVSEAEHEDDARRQPRKPARPSGHTPRPPDRTGLLLKTAALSTELRGSGRTVARLARGTGRPPSRRGRLARD